MRRKTFLRYEGTSTVNGVERYTTVRYSFLWNETEEFLIRYMKIYHPELAKYILEPSLPNEEPSFGFWVKSFGSNTITVKSIMMPGLGMERISTTFQFKTKFEKRYAIRCILAFFEMYMEKNKKKGGNK